MWEQARAALVEREKAHTRHGDAFAAERRRLPIIEIAKPHEPETDSGPMVLAGLGENRRPLIVHDSMYAPSVDRWPQSAPYIRRRRHDEYPDPGDTTS